MKPVDGDYEGTLFLKRDEGWESLECACTFVRGERKLRKTDGVYIRVKDLPEQWMVKAPPGHLLPIRVFVTTTGEVFHYWHSHDLWFYAFSSLEAILLL